MIRKTALIAALAVAGIPAGALAAKPAHPVHPTTPGSTNASTPASSNANGSATKKVPTVLFVIHGTLSSYVAANGPTNGGVKLAITSSSTEQAMLKSQAALTVTLSSKTNVVLHDGKPIANGDKGIVKIRAPKNASAATLAATPAQQVIDQGPSK
jgi:hypothetical protein